MFGPGRVGVPESHGEPEVEFRVLVGYGRLECRGEKSESSGLGGTMRLAERKNGLARVGKGVGWAAARADRGVWWDEKNEK